MEHNHEHKLGEEIIIDLAFLPNKENFGWISALNIL
jgi:hypothetical protein